MSNRNGNNCNMPQYFKHPDIGINTDEIDTENTISRHSCVMVMQQLDHELGYNVLRGSAVNKRGQRKR
jgi:hypothetical protein